VIIAELRVLFNCRDQLQFCVILLFIHESGALPQAISASVANIVKQLPNWSVAHGSFTQLTMSLFSG